MAPRKLDPRVTVMRQVSPDTCKGLKHVVIDVAGLMASLGAGAADMILVQGERADGERVDVHQCAIRAGLVKQTAVCLDLTEPDDVEKSDRLVQPHALLTPKGQLVFKLISTTQTMQAIFKQMHFVLQQGNVRTTLATYDISPKLTGKMAEQASFVEESRKRKRELEDANVVWPHKFPCFAVAPAAPQPPPDTAGPESLDHLLEGDISAEAAAEAVSLFQLNDTEALWAGDILEDTAAEAVSGDRESDACSVLSWATNTTVKARSWLADRLAEETEAGGAESEDKLWTASQQQLTGLEDIDALPEEQVGGTDAAVEVAGQSSSAPGDRQEQQSTVEDMDAQPEQGGQEDAEDEALARRAEAPGTESPKSETA